MTFVVALLSSVLSGIAGGGGGFLMAPYWLLIGMTPAQSATSGAFMAVGMGASSLFAFRKTKHYPQNKKLTRALLVLTIVFAVVGALTLSRIDSGSYKVLLACITLLSIPLLFIDRSTITLSERYITIGRALLILLLLISSLIATSAFSILIAVCLMQLFNLSVLESTALRRLIGLVQAAVIFIVLALHGDLLFLHALVATVGGSLGSYIGTVYAIKRGETFAKYALAAGAIMGSIALLA